jgi:hypothetical protein
MSHPIERIQRLLDEAVMKLSTIKRADFDSLEGYRWERVRWDSREKALRDALRCFADEPPKEAA